MIMKKTIFSLLFLSLFGLGVSFACTSYLITKGASADGSTMISDAADSHVLYGELYFWPAADYPAGSMLDVYEWDTGEYLGKIKQVKHTYSVVGFMNEFQVSLAETTYGGRGELRDTTGIIDYGSLMFIALQRSKTAREAIKVMTDLVAEYGYYSSGESFSIADPNEVWIMELIGKGPGNKGAVWVARLVPDGYICAHANQARITTFEFQKENKWDDPERTVYNSPDVISFAKEKGYFKGKDKDFSFSDTYAPVGFGGARFCEARVWAMFRQVKEGMDQYLDYVKGHIKYDDNHYATNRMPLWIKPDRKISVKDVMLFTRNHFEGTELDMTKDMGAGPFKCPYRWRPLTWKVDDVSYCNERAAATQQTGFQCITQARSWLPNPIGGICWFSVDDASSTVYVPMYCGITEVPESYARGNGKMMEFTRNAAFWVFNEVSNFAYTRYNVVHPEIEKVQQELEGKFIAFTPAIDKAAEELYKTDKDLGLQFITEYSVKQGNNTVDRWKELYKYLFTKYMDGNIKTKDGDKQNPIVKQPGYGEEWYKRIVNETGDHFKVIGEEGH